MPQSVMLRFPNFVGLATVACLVIFSGGFAGVFWGVAQRPNSVLRPKCFVPFAGVSSDLLQLPGFAWVWCFFFVGSL